jgi:hypothetical protein
MQYFRALAALVLALGLVTPALAQAPAPASNPGTPQNIAKLQNFNTMVAMTNLASGAVRLIVVLDPASTGADAAMKAVESVLGGNPSKRLRAFVVWSAVSAGSTEARATARSTVHDRRLVYFYDPQATVANAFKNVVGSGDAPATDVLLLYDTDAHLAPEPPAPSLWMSANKSIKGTALDATQLGASTNELVRRVEEKVTDGAAPKK